MRKQNCNFTTFPAHQARPPKKLKNILFVYCVFHGQGWAIRQKIIELHVKQYKKNNCIVQFNMQLIVNCNCMRLDKAISDAI